MICLLRKSFFWCGQDWLLTQPTWAGFEPALRAGFKSQITAKRTDRPKPVCSFGADGGI